MNNKVKFKGPMKHFMRWPLYLSVLVVLLDLLVFIVSVKAGILVSVGTVIYIFIAVQLFRYHKPLIINDMIAFANQYDVVEKRMLEELALPYAIMDMEGRMIWSNRIFSEITGRDQFYKKNISTVFPDITPDKLPVADEPEISEMSIHFGDRIYRVSMQRVTMGEVVSHADILENMSQNVSLIAMYLYDETELKEYIQKNEDNKLVVALAYLDNYEEALESVEDVRRSLLIALIDRKITKYFSNFDGLVKKLEKDKYLLIMRQSSLETLKEQRFHILDEVKTVNIGNEMAVTLSIGIGLNASTYIQNYEYARIAIEMALGRGGDQVVIKNENNITYIGGKAQQMEKSTRVKARVKAQALKEFMSIKYENKVRLAKYIKEHNGIEVDPRSIFDVQVKRLHEYKRQLLNILHVMYLYNEIKEHPEISFYPRTFIFGAKASAGYIRAKQIIKLINSVADVVNNDRSINGKLKVVFIEDYRVSNAEIIFAAADVSEQISTASKEASGTGNMKFMLNGAPTLGTMDGANVEIVEEVGAENAFIFGLSSDEVINYENNGGYNPMDIYNSDADIRRVVNQLVDGTYSQGDKEMYRDLYNSLLTAQGGSKADTYFILKDFRSYADTQKKVEEAYRDKDRWAKMALLNTASCGKFSSDRTIQEYVDDIWHLDKVTVEV